MTVYEKVKLDIADVKVILSEHFSHHIGQITPIEGGNISRVFAFSFEDKNYVIKFSDVTGSYETERYISNLLTSQGIPFPRYIGLGKFNSLNYLISEKISGKILKNCSYKQQQALFPEVIQLLTRMNHVKIESTKGYGFIKRDGNGTFPSWREHIEAAYEENQEGTFWEDWYSLFNTSCLEKDVFDECYNRLLAYSVYNEPHRYFVHGDFHQWNILSDGQRITGMIDSNGKYGDFLIDLATLDWHLKTHLRKQDVVEQYVSYQQQIGIEIPDFKERVIGAKYYNGLIGLRFFAKMGWDHAYVELRDELLSLI